MITPYQQQLKQQLERILSFLPKKADKQFAGFAERFYAKLPASDLAQMEPQAALAMAESALEFMKKREGNAPKIRIFHPEKTTHGYDSKHTVVELLNDDMPFLVDSLTAELSRRGFTIYDTIHPIFSSVRDSKGNLAGIGGGKNESLIHFEISGLPDNVSAEELQTDLEWVLQHIRASVQDWQSIMEKAKLAAAELEKNPAEEAREAHDFLLWVANKNFVFLGYAEYAIAGETVAVVPQSRLGILKITDDGAEQQQGAHLLEISKSNRRSLVHRPVPMDYIGVKRVDAQGKFIGEARFFGLFTSNVYYQATDGIPVVRSKIARTVARSDFDPISHDGKSLKAILEFLPRDEIFQMTDDELFETSMGILALEAKPGVRVFARKDAFERFVSAMIFVPRERFSTELRRQIQDIIERAYNGQGSTFSTQITEAPLARLHLIVRTAPGDIPAVNLAAVEQEVAKCAYLWSDMLRDALSAKHGDKVAGKFQRIYGGAFPQSYINRYDATAAVYDIDKVEAVQASGSLSLDLFRNRAEAETIFHLKIYNPNEEIALSDILPMLENAGFRVIEEHPFLITALGGLPVWIRDFRLQREADAQVTLEQVKPFLEEALLKVWQGEMENDRFNALTLRAGLHWRQVVMLRAYGKYLKQTGFAQAQSSIEQAFSAHPAIAKHIVALFEARFGLQETDRAGRQAALLEAIEQQLSQVSNAAQDKILRRYTELMNATLRTNYFQTSKPVLSFKFQSAHVPDLPKPVPFREIFVYSPRVEGIHLRGGKVARGGLRWSDRADDFRTEVLGLMKAQMVKNSVIVPVGSKGGFIVKRPPAARDAFLEEGIACYKLYLSGLLDITDNIVAGNIRPPEDTVRHDEDDPYLVVAADKGTATFSDIANSMSAQYGFWLDDAFASGGSAGYDHKKMAITARGGFVSVRRHFAEMGVDIDREAFTVAGVGDMAGDVFGNGMVLSENIKLVAAFNHLHIFLDPAPDAKTSFVERQRLFNLPRSSWKDYDAALISPGGGIFERSAKTIAIGKEAQAALGVSKANFTPDELIRAILLAPVDLLWNGGIGTYVKAEDESHEQVGDRANNGLRVNGRELRCKIVGEGGNLGFTQKGRIEYAKNGGRINTDAIDNSAGVDCSDHEVNIKIAFSQEVMSGALTTARRDQLLVAMTDEVAELVLKDNRLQTQAISVAQAQGVALLDSHVRLIHRLEKIGLLDRAIEFLPSDKQLADLKLAKKGLTRPELAVLLAYSKMALYNEILGSTLPDDAYFTADLKRYFPQAMREDFLPAITAHPLKREIIATSITNSVVNRAGIGFAGDMAKDLNVSLRDVAAAYALARDAFGLHPLWRDMELAGVDTQADLHQTIQQFLTRAALWLLRNVPLPLDIGAVSKDLLPALADIQAKKDTLHSDATKMAEQARFAALRERGVPEAIAEKIAGLDLLSSAFDIIAVARSSGQSPQQVGALYFDIGARAHLAQLRAGAEAIAADSQWERLAVQALAGDFYDEQRRLTSQVIAQGKTVDAWADERVQPLSRLDQFIQELGTPDLPKLMVALRYIKAL